MKLKWVLLFVAMSSVATAQPVKTINSEYRKMLQVCDGMAEFQRNTCRQEEFVNEILKSEPQATSSQQIVDFFCMYLHCFRIFAERSKNSLCQAAYENLIPYVIQNASEHSPQNEQFEWACDLGQELVKKEIIQKDDFNSHGVKKSMSDSDEVAQVEREKSAEKTESAEKGEERTEGGDEKRKALSLLASSGFMVFPVDLGMPN